MRSVVSFIVAALTIYIIIKGIEVIIAASILIMAGVYFLIGARKIYKYDLKNKY